MYGIRSFLSAGAFLGLALVNVKAQDVPDKPPPPGSSEADSFDSTGSASASRVSGVPGYPNCDVTWPGWIGDGYCDRFYGDYNTADCGYDGGDCCECDCVDALYKCGVVGYDCRDPSSSCVLLCNSIGCPAGFTPIDRAWEIPCEGGSCEVSQCCEAFCSYYACPPNYTPVINAAEIKCSDEPDGCTTELCCDGGECGVSYGPCDFDGVECCDDTFVCYDVNDNDDPECVPISSIDTGGCAQLWGQCGGNEYDGPTCCGPFAECEYSNDWFSQCLPSP